MESIQTNVSLLTVEQLKTELGKLQLETTGKKDVLVARLIAAITNNAKKRGDVGDAHGEENLGDSTDTDDDGVNATNNDDALNRMVSLLLKEIKNTNKTNRPGISVKDVENSISVFTGDDAFHIKKWLSEFEDLAEMMKWGELEKFVYAKKQLSGTAKLFIRSCSCSSYMELKQMLVDEFDKPVCKADIYRKLQKRKKKPDESFREYTLHMKELAGQADVDSTSLIQFIIDGIPDREENKLIFYGASSMTELRNRWEIYEKIKAKVGDGGRQSSADKFKPSVPDTGRQSGQRQRVEHCYNCGSRDHKRRDCRAATKCFRCNGEGHMSNNCTQITQRNHSREANVVSIARMYKTIKVNQCVFVQALVDTGIEATLLREDVFRGFPNIKLKPSSLNLVGLAAGKARSVGSFDCRLEIDSVVVENVCHVVPNDAIRCPMIIGSDVITKAKVVIDANGITFSNISEENYIMHIEAADDNEIDVPAKYQDEIRQLIAGYDPRQIVEPPVKMSLVLSDERPVFVSPRRFPFQEQRIIKDQVHEWLEAGIVRPSSSPFATGVVLVKKKDGSPRVCIDYRRLNKQLIKDHFPVPLIEELLDRLQDAVVFSTMDLKNGYFHVPVEETSRKYTAFMTAEGQFEFTRVPFGLSNSPAVFLRYIHMVFRHLVAKNIVLTYMDDLIIPSRDETENLEKLKQVLEVASQNGLQIKWKKCSFLQRRVEFLGHIVERGTIRPSEAKLKAVQNFPELKTVRDVQAFLGLTGYFRRFIHEYSLTARPLSELLKKGVPFTMGIEQRQSVAALKGALSASPVLAIFKQGVYTEVHTDASKAGCAAILLQRGDDGKLHPVYYSSHKNSIAEEKLHSYVLEVKAVYLALKKFRVYLLGSSFTVITDCNAFVQTVNKKDLPAAVSRWVMDMQEFDFQVKHRTGSRMAHVDSLSRYPSVFLIQNEFMVRLRKAQESDDHIKSIKKILENSEYEDYVLKGGMLFKIMDGREVFVVPRSMEKEVIKRKHEEGHFAAQKAMHLISREFFIKNLKQKIESCIANCVACILAARKGGKQEGFLTPIDKDSRPLQTYHLDHLGSMDPTAKNYRYILTVVDGFCKYVWLYPTKTLGAEEVIRRLKDQQQCFGNPARIITDRGGAFISDAFKEFCAVENIEHVAVTAGVPRGNGQAERINRIVIEILKKLSAESSDKWYKFIGRVQFAINTTYQRSINRTPFEVLFGVPVRKKDDLEIQQLIREESLKIFDEERDQLRWEARLQIEKIQKENRKTFDRKRKEERIYEKGDLIAIKRTQFNPGKKICSDFLGPYEVIRRGRAGRYTVRQAADVEGPKQTTTCCEFMKPWRSEVSSEEENSSETEENQDGRV